MKAGTIVSCIFIACLLPLSLTAAIIHVPGDQPTIQAGIGAAVDGDTVLVAPGTYWETIIFLGKTITVQSESGAELTIIDGNQAASVVTFVGGETSDTVLEGFTIRNGEASQGGGIYCSDSSPTIANCTFSGNEAFDSGGGILCWNSSANITYCTFSANHAGGKFGGDGGGIRCTYSSLTITNCTFSANHAGVGDAGLGGGIFCAISSPTITNCTFSANHAGGMSGGAGGGINCDTCSSTITNCTFSDNTAVSSGGGIRCFAGSTTITNCIFWNNNPDGINGSGTLTVTYSDVQGGWPGEGNIDSDPLFVAGPEGDYYLSQVDAGQVVDSPCLDAGSEPAADICFTTHCREICLDMLSTRTDHARDIDTVDMGYHYGFSADWCTVSATFICTPTSGTVPFSTQMTVALKNLYTGQIRRIAGRINVAIASGNSYSNWKSGWTNVGAGSSFKTSWSQTIPELGSVIGENVFTLEAEDVTPAPYNQQPYPPAGDIDTVACAVTGIYH